MPKRRMSMPPTPAKRSNLGQVVRRIPRTVARRIPGTVIKYAGPLGQAYSYGQVALRGIRAISRRNKYVQKRRAAGKQKSKSSAATQTSVLKKMGASMSKSSGRFTTGKADNVVLNKFLNQGVIIHREIGDVVSDATKDVVYLAHSCCPKRTVIRAAYAAMVKYLCKKAGIKIKSWESPILIGSNIPARLEIQYKENDGRTVLTKAFTMPVTHNLLLVCQDFWAWLDTLNATVFPQQWLRLTYYHDIGTIGSSRLLAYDIDLTTCGIEVYGTSHLKIQNRTINSTGNDQADDVDNVPIYGRSYDVRYNGTTFRDYNSPLTVGNPQLRTDSDYGVMNFADQTGLATDSTLYKEVAQPSQFVGVLSHGNAHLDPGEIKTSTINFHKTISFNRLITLYKTKGLQSPGIEFYFGKTRIFGFEKMINAVALNETNQYKIAFESDLKVGAICHIKENHQTALLTESTTGNTPV